MRRYRPLTIADRWDLALLLGVLVVAFSCAAAVNRSGFVTRYFAFAAQRDDSRKPAHTPDSVAPSHNLRSALQRPELLPDASDAVVDVAPPVTNVIPPATQRPKTVQAFKTPPKPAAPSFKWYDGEKYRYLKTLRMRVTAYAPDKRCCWPYPGTTTASGQSVKTNRGKLVAADTRLLPFNSLVSIPGYHAGETVPVLDRGRAIKGHRLDVLLPTFEQAKEWGSRLVDVKIYVPVDD